MSNAFTPATGGPGGWGPSPESAPSVLREDQPTLARVLGLFGAALVIMMVLRPRGLVSGRTPSVALGRVREVSAELVAQGRG